MKNIGYLLITAGFLAGSLAAVLDERLVQWTLFAGGLAVGVVGIVLVRLGARRLVQAQGGHVATIKEVEGSLSRIVDNMALLNREKDSINPYDVPNRIETLLVDDLMAFADAREGISHLYGLQAYADVMNHFATGERHLNRVWSASADGYVDEMRTYLASAQAQFVAAKERLDRLKASASLPV